MLNQLATMPRDSRDSLFLLVVIAWVILPHVSHLPAWSIAYVLLVLLWRAHLAWQTKKLPGRSWRLIGLAIGVGATLWSYRTLQGRDAGVTLLVLLLALKTLELRARRDTVVVFFLSFFVLLTQFLFSQTMLSAVMALIGLLGLLTGLVNSHMPLGKPSLALSAGVALRLMALGVPMMALLFFLFPRVAPLWGIPDQIASGRSGLSASMRVGSIAELALDESVAMRIHFEGSAPMPQDLYFRGPVLSIFDGREWSSQRGGLASRGGSKAKLEVEGSPVRYEATLEPTQRPWLMLMDAAPEPPQSDALAAGTPRMSQDLQWLAATPITNVVRYTAQSYPKFRHGPLVHESSLQDDLYLPPGFNPRTYELAASLLARARQQASSPQADQLVEMALAHLRNGGYRYTLEPGIYGQHAADEFWFDRKEGFCEHIASSFVVLMRALGIPSRIVTGYQGGEYNALGGYWIIRQSDAHAWTEVWLEQQGWVRIDPTAVVSPGRIGALQRLLAPRGAVATALDNFTPVLAINLRAMWDAMNHQWNQWIINYTQHRQNELLRALGISSPDWPALIWLLGVCLTLFSLAGLGWSWHLQRTQDPWHHMLRLARQRLQATGLLLPAQATPREMARQLSDWPDFSHLKLLDNQRQAIIQWLLKLEGQRYSAINEEGRRRMLMQLKAQMKLLSWPK